jgi:hypothetical protein
MTAGDTSRAQVAYSLGSIADQAKVSTNTASQIILMSSALVPGSLW